MIAVLQSAGVSVQERTIKPQELTAADEVFSTGNYGKVQPVTRLEDRHMQPGPIYRQARQLCAEVAADMAAAAA